jgi:hypothetical protein
MPVLPTLESSQSVFSSVPLRSQEIQSSPADFGGLVAQGAERLGQGFDQAGAQVGDAAMRQLDMQRETNANNQYANSFSPALRQIYTNYYALQGKDAVDQLPKFQQQIQDLQQQQRDQLKDPVAQHMFDQVSTRRTQMELDGMSRYADQQNKVYQQQASDGMVKAFQQQAMDKWNDPILFNGMLNSVEAERMSHAAATGMPVEYAKAQIQQDTSKMWTDRLQMMANQDPVAAYQTLENGEDWKANGQAQHTDVKSEIDTAVLPSLEAHLLNGAKQVLARNVAHGFIYGSGAVDPDSLSAATQGAPALTGVVKSLEGGAGPNGESLTSPKGAQGEMQVTGPTQRDPGFGVTPAKDNSPQEIARVGRDYLGAMTARYQDPALTLAAYNAGPGQVDKWIAKYGDPRTGQVSDADWAAKIPFAETRDYVGKGLTMVQQPGDKPTAMPTTNELKTVLPQKVADARDVATRMFPNDPTFADAVASRVASYGNTILEGAQAQENAARDTLTRIMVGNKPDGSDRVTTMDQLMANPEAKAAWGQATPEVQAAIQDRLSKASAPLTQDGLNEYYRLRGEAANDPEAFMKENLAGAYGKMPDHLVLDLINQQTSISRKDATAAQRDLNWNRTKSDVEDMLRPMGLGASAKAGSKQADTTSQFYGKLNQAIEDYHDQNKKYPDTTTTRKIAGALLVQGSQDSGHWYSPNKTMPAFESPDLSQFAVPVPPAQKQQLAATFQKVMGHAPSDNELGQWYTKYQLSQGGK